MIKLQINGVLYEARADFKHTILGKKMPRYVFTGKSAPYVNQPLVGSFKRGDLPLSWIKQQWFKDDVPDFRVVADLKAMLWDDMQDFINESLHFTLHDFYISSAWTLFNLKCRKCGFTFQLNVEQPRIKRKIEVCVYGTE